MKNLKSIVKGVVLKNKRQEDKKQEELTKVKALNESLTGAGKAKKLASSLSLKTKNHAHLPSKLVKKELAKKLIQGFLNKDKKDTSDGIAQLPS